NERSAAARRLTFVLAAPAAQLVEQGEDSRPITIAAPLSADAWRDLLEVPRNGDLFAALVSNRGVLLTCAGALSGDPSLRDFLEHDRGLLRWIVRNTPGAFTLAGRSLRFANDRLVLPGGAAAEPVWEALAGERVAKTADFVRALLSRDNGRLAWFFDTMATLPEARRAALMPAGKIEDQLEPIRALYSTFRSIDPNWRVEDHPFLRGNADAWMIATQVALQGGVPAPPNWQWLWQELFGTSDLSRREAAGVSRTASSPVSMAWLAQKIAEQSPRERRDRFEMVRFAQSVFGNAAEADALDIAVALGGYRKFRSALLTLDRMEITSPKTMARMVDAARRASERPGREQRNGIVALQSSLAIIERARLSRTIDAPTAERLVLSLADAVDRNAPMPPAAAQWIVDTLVKALPPLIQPDRFTTQTAYESTILQAMAGPAEEPDIPEVAWEGLTYRVDLYASELARLTRIRDQLVSPGLDNALAGGQPAAIADALVALVYSAAMGDPDGPGMLSRDVAQRHAFGLDAPSGARAELLAWMPPRDQVGDGIPWHVEGALTGLDLGLARLALRRIADNDMPVAPSINLNDQFTLARTIAVLNPRELRDADRDELVAAIARGRARVAAAGHDLKALTPLAEEAQLSITVRQMLPWMVVRTPESIPELFGLRDLMWLGAPAIEQGQLDRWGVYSEPLDSRLHAVMPRPAPWENFGGRADSGMMGTQAPDLTLRLAQETARLKLPARLIPALLTYATQDYWHDVSARFSDDWPAMTRQALALSPSRVEDYVAALTGDGPLRTVQ
ncbi:MAG: hypothetical protein ABI665_22900, partial [Vicinamibacterales bacterium]